MLILASGNWVVNNLENAIDTWNDKLSEIWQIITQSPEAFKGGTIWQVILKINGAVQAIGLALLVLFFVSFPIFFSINLLFFFLFYHIIA